MKGYSVKDTGGSAECKPTKSPALRAPPLRKGEYSSRIPPLQKEVASPRAGGFIGALLVTNKSPTPTPFSKGE